MTDVPTLPALLLARAATDGATTILRRKDRGIWQAESWSGLATRVRAIGLALRGAGLAPGDVAGILAETGPDWIAADLAIQGAGAIALGLPPSDAAGPTAETLAASACRLLFVENEEQLDKVLHVRDRCPALRRIVIMDMKGLREFADPICVSLESFAAEAPDGDWPSMVAGLDPAAAAILVATAGTSAAPRLVALSHAILQTQIRHTAALLGQTGADERLGFLPLSLVTERVFGLYVGLACGSITNLVESAETVPENLQEVRPSVIFAIPRIWEKLHATVMVAAGSATLVQRHMFAWAMRQAAPRADGHTLGGIAALADRLVLAPVRAAIGLDRARLAFAGGAPLSAELVRWYRTLGIDLRQVYGTAECAGIAAISPPSFAQPGVAAPPAGAGTPVSWGELTLGPDGAVRLRGPHLAASLWQGAPLADADGWFDTGDLGRIADGALVLSGRQGEAISAGATRIEPAAIEARLKLSPFIADALLVGHGHGHGRASIGCLVLLEFDAVEKWAQERNVPFTSSASLARTADVNRLIAAELAARAGDIALPTFRILPNRIEPEDPEVTQAMRLRRHLVLEKHRDLIEDMYRTA